MNDLSFIGAIDDVCGIYENSFVFSSDRKKIYAYVYNNVILINGDTEASSFYYESKNAVTISFRCLARFRTGGKTPSLKDIKHTLESICDVKYTEDSVLTGSPKVQPGPGYVWVSYMNRWHRAASVLIQLLNEEVEKVFILMGVDEDQYFGCQLQGSPSSIEEAFVDLMPEHIRKVHPSNLARQGEWFFVRIEDDPMTFDGAEKFKINYEEHGVHYYLRGRNDNEESNTHVVEAKEYVLVNDTYSLANGRKVPIFHNPTISHNQHQDLDLGGWWWAVENTAVKSYSEMGVD